MNTEQEVKIQKQYIQKVHNLLSDYNQKQKYYILKKIIAIIQITIPKTILKTIPKTIPIIQII